MLNSFHWKAYNLKLIIGHHEQIMLNEIWTFIPISHNYKVFFFLEHNFKKIRNSIQKSNPNGKPRCLQIHGKNTTWKQLKDAHLCDQNNFSLPVHEKFTLQHFELDSAAKMRNHLADSKLTRLYPNLNSKLLQANFLIKTSLSFFVAHAVISTGWSRKCKGWHSTGCYNYSF